MRRLDGEGFPIAPSPPVREWRPRSLKFSVGLFALSSTLLMVSGCSTETHLSFLDPQGPIAAAQRSHFYWVLGIMAVLVAAPIFMLLPFFVWRYRYGTKSPRYTPKWKAFLPLEIASWGGPVIIVAVLAFFVWRDSHKLDPYKPLTSAQAPLRVEVIGYDWKWLFIYPDQGIASIGVMALPVARPVTMQLTSATVMQSFFIPALGSQIYAMGGMVTQLNLEANEPGRSLGENTMYNGDGFHQQQFTAIAMTPDAFEAWIRQIQANGVPLDDSTYRMLSQRSTQAQLFAVLPRTKSTDGNVYLNEVTDGLFSAVVNATADGTSVTLALAPAPLATTESPAIPPVKSTAPSTEKPQ